MEIASSSMASIIRKEDNPMWENSREVMRTDANKLKNASGQRLTLKNE